MERLIKEIVDKVDNTSHRIMIGISGHGASGKTTFAKKLIEVFGENNVNYLNTDPYIIDSAVRKNTLIDYEYNNQRYRYKMTACHPAAHHLLSLERDVMMLKEGMDLYTIGTHWSVSTLLTSKKKVTIVEGMSVAFIKPSIFDITIYFYTDSHMEYERRSVRDIKYRGMDINYLKQSHNERRNQYDVFMHPFHENFDVVVKTANGEVIVEKMMLV